MGIKRVHIRKELLHLAIPNIISNITVPLLGIADMFLMGRMESVDYIGAIGLGSMIFNFIYWGFGFLRMSTGGFAAQAFGSKDEKAMIAILIRSLLIGVCGAFFVIALQFPIERLGFYLIHGESNVESLAQSYFYIRIWAAPATILIYAFTGWFIGMQDAKVPMYGAIIINVVNIGFNFFFVYILGLKSDGVAYGTVIAQYAGLLVFVFFFMKKYKHYLKYYSRNIIFKAEEFLRFFNVSKDIFIRTMLLVFVISFIQAESAKIDSTILAINNVLLQFFTLFSFVVDGFAHAGEAVSGKYYGANEKRNFRISIIENFKLGFWISLFFTFIYFLFNGSILKIFTDIPEILNGAPKYMLWIIVIPIISFAAFLWDGIFIGITASKGLRNSMVISSILFFCLYYLTLNYSNHGLWFSFVAFLMLRGISQTLIYRFLISKSI